MGLVALNPSSPSTPRPGGVSAGAPSSMRVPSSTPAPSAEGRPSFDAVYEQQFAFVWRNVRSLGAAPSALEDLVQDVFVVVHRRIDDYDPERASIKTWLFGILRRVVRDHRRTMKRKPAHFGTREADAEIDTMTDATARGPHENAARAEAVRTLRALLESLDEEKREVFVLAEIEQMTVPEIA
jgi:RNA polymerase sigma-70 factor (ECF subfamily)